MFRLATHLKAAYCAGFAFLATALSASAQMAPPPVSKGNIVLTMFDARVNGKGSYQNALSIRPGAAQTGLNSARAQAKAIASAAAAYKKTLPTIHIDFSNLTGAPRMVVAGTQPLTGPSAASGDNIARTYLTQHGDLFGLTDADLADLTTLGDSKGGSSGLRMVRIEQRIAGRPIFQSETRFLMQRNGSLAEVTGQLIPNAHASAAQIDWSSALSAEKAAASALNDVGVSVSESDFSRTDGLDGRIELSSSNDALKGGVTTRQVFFPLAPGVLVPAWSVVAFTSGDHDWYAIVDAQTGDTLWRKNIRNYASTQDARFRVYVQSDGVTPAASPAPNSAHTTVNPGSGTQFPAISPTIVNMHTAYDPIASQNGWIDDCPGGVCTANETQTLGNNVLACMDITQGANANICDTSAAGAIDGNGRPTGNPDGNGRNRDFLGTTPRDFETNFLPPPQGGNPEAGQTSTGNGNNGTLAIDQFRRGTVTHLFYSLNWYHDKLFELGFDEASANFQQTNFSGMGLGGDRVLADVDDGSGTNNANFSTPPDGTSGRMQMYRFTGPTIDRDGSLDAEVFMHEATHGVSNRLVGNGAGLNWDPAGGMGEGWSDFVALSLLNNTNADDPDARYASGGYATYKLIAGYTDNYVYGIRRFPYSTDNTVNPLTWADVDDVSNDISGGIAPDPIGFNGNGGFEVHNIGEVWANTLWGVRSRIIKDPAGANGDVPTGNHTALQLVIDGLKMTPIDPTFTQARDAILGADCATNACANESSIWGGFAYRGLGYKASQPYNTSFGFNASHMGIHESFSSPYLDVVDALTDVTIDDSASNNNGAFDPGEAVKLSAKLTNPWRAAGKAATGITATLSSSTPGVTIYNGSGTYSNIAPQASATGTSFVVGLDASVACGSSLDFTLTTTSSLGTTATTFTLRAGSRNGTDSLVTYTRNPAMAVPDGQPRGVFDSLTITDDFEIANVSLRADNVTHTFTGDLSFMLRSPAGIGEDSISLIDGLTDGGSGDNLTNMVVDDGVVASTATDMVQQTATRAPYTGSWVPVFNAPWTSLAGFPSPDPVGTFARYNGTGVKGTWNLLVSDQFAVDTGTVNAWSMLVTPVHFTCATVTQAVNLAATKTVSGTYDRGGTVTYTVTLTNNGNVAQPDNAGNEFTDVLPPGLTLVSATASSGTAVATTGTNTVTWNGSLAPLGGSVTITVTATINNSAGSTVSNQGTVSYASDGGATNNATLLTDDPGQPGATDPTVFTLNSADIAATKTVSGNFWPFQVVTYTVTLTNNGTGIANNNSGDEFVDILPAGLTLRSAVADAGSVSVGIVGSTATVRWNGSLAVGASVTITIKAQIGLINPGQTISNQGTVQYGAYEGSTNDTTVLTDDPSVGGATDPTTFTIIDEIFRDGFDGN